jgi:hypothetical protein
MANLNKEQTNIEEHMQVIGGYNYFIYINAFSS